MGDIYEKVKTGRTALEKLTDFIPGWSGYQDRQSRRKADKLMRQNLAKKMSLRRQDLDAIQRDLVDHGKMDFLDDVESAVTQLQAFIDRVRLASYGYSGLFDAVKINEAELEQMYNFDAALFDYVGRLKTATDRLREAVSTGEGLAQTIRTVQDTCREANDAFSQREHLILESQ